ncbi:MAG: glycosyltransferase family 4 protein [Rickettsiaceae bacterium]|nr:glycosyltransferase family 4 protein [Rickettsiaceae bacterium]
MRIFNVMMSRDLGGIQQAYADYSDALKMQGHEVINITSIFALINRKSPARHSLLNLAPWCFLSRLYLWLLVVIYKPDLIICHGNRAISFSIYHKLKDIPIIGVAHNYSYKYLRKCDYVFTVTSKLKEYLIEQGFDAKRLMIVPNMVKIQKKYKTPIYRKPVIIGSFGRFVTKKGFTYLIEAIKLLNQNGCQVKLILGGDGKNKHSLVKQVQDLRLANDVIFHGWVTDKKQFFSKIDLFCLPSIEEPFGIILLEAMEYSKPIVATKSGGPEEIIRNSIDGLLAEAGSSVDLADKLQAVISNQSNTENLTKSAYNRLHDSYDIKVVSIKLSSILNKIKKHEL